MISVTHRRLYFALNRIFYFIQIQKDFSFFYFIMISNTKFIVSAVVALLAYYAFSCFYEFFQTPQIPKLNADEWWGLGEPKPSDYAVIPFKINVSDMEVVDLKERLTKFLVRPHIPPFKDQGFQYGFNPNYLKQIVNYWLHQYNWRDREKYLNKYPQYKTNINGLDIHFIRVTPKSVSGKQILPLLLLHGWPGSVREFYEVIPFLTTPKKEVNFVFEVVVPSLPGYGFSQGATKPGFGPANVAVILTKLMTRLKFQKFYVHGGDWGSFIGKIMGQLFPEKVLGYHSTMCMVNTPLSNTKLILGSLYPPLVVEDKYRHRIYPLKKIFLGYLKEIGYFVIQATKPDTIGTALSDTPAGLAAYILEKFSTGTNRAWITLQDGGLTQKYSLDSLLDNVMIYWFTNSITTSQRLYFEAFNSYNFVFNRLPLKVPTACARFENEVVWQPTNFLREQYLNLLQVNDIENGGHFAAFEEPKKFCEDVWSAIQKFQAFHEEFLKSSQ